MKKKTMCSVPGCGNENTGEMMIYRMDIDKKLFLPLCTFCHDAMLSCYSTIIGTKEMVNSALHAEDGCYLVTMNDKMEYRAEKVKGVWYWSTGSKRYLMEYPQTIVSIKKIDGTNAPLAKQTPEPDAATGQPDPIRSTYSRAEIGAKAREFMEREYGKSFDADDRDAWYAKYGFLISFIHEHFPEGGAPA